MMYLTSHPTPTDVPHPEQWLRPVVTTLLFHYMLVRQYCEVLEYGGGARGGVVSQDRLFQGSTITAGNFRGPSFSY